MRAVASGESMRATMVLFLLLAMSPPPIEAWCIEMPNRTMCEHAHQCRWVNATGGCKDFMVATNFTTETNATCDLCMADCRRAAEDEKAKDRCDDCANWDCVDQHCSRTDCKCQIEVSSKFRCWEHPYIADIWGTRYVTFQVMMLVTWSVLFVWGCFVVSKLRKVSRVHAEYTSTKTNKPSRRGSGAKKNDGKGTQRLVALLTMIAIVARFFWSFDPKMRCLIGEEHTCGAPPLSVLGSVLYSEIPTRLILLKVTQLALVAGSIQMTLVWTSVVRNMNKMKRINQEREEAFMKRVVKVLCTLLALFVLPCSILGPYFPILGTISNLFFALYVLILIVAGTIYGTKLALVISMIVVKMTKKEMSKNSEQELRKARESREAIKKIFVLVFFQVINGSLVAGGIIWNAIDRDTPFKHLDFFFVIHFAEALIAVNLLYSSSPSGADSAKAKQRSRKMSGSTVATDTSTASTSSAAGSVAGTAVASVTVRSTSAASQDSQSLTSSRADSTQNTSNNSTGVALTSTNASSGREESV